MFQHWLIELYAHKVLTQALWVIVGMTAPVWLLMIVSPRKRWVKFIASPFVSPPLLTLVLIYLLYLTFTVGPPELPTGIDYSQSKAFIAHPLILLVMVCNTQILHLFLGTILFREANRHKVMARFELLLTWILGPVGWLCFVVRMKFFSRWLQ